MQEGYGKQNQIICLRKYKRDERRCAGGIARGIRAKIGRRWRED